MAKIFLFRHAQTTDNLEGIFSGKRDPELTPSGVEEAKKIRDELKDQKVTKATGAIPYDVPGVELGHVDGRCSFESMIVKYDLKEPGLLRLAKIVHTADVEKDIDTDPIARGLEAIASGYSLRFPEDMENLEHQFEVYDALYAWCRLDVMRK